MSEKIDVRFGELLIPQDFIRIDSRVKETAELARGLPERDAVYCLWDYVCRNIKYPAGPAWLPLDRHVLRAFPKADRPFLGLQYSLERKCDEYFQYGSETLSWGIGDCEDTSILLTSLLRAYGIPPDRAFVAVGEAPDGYAWLPIPGHAWVAYNDGERELILETSLESAPPNPWRHYPHYRELWRFNDIERIGDIQLVPKTDERAKLKGLGLLWDHPAKGA